MRPSDNVRPLGTGDQRHQELGPRLATARSASRSPSGLLNGSGQRTGVDALLSSNAQFS